MTTISSLLPIFKTIIFKFLYLYTPLFPKLDFNIKRVIFRVLMVAVVLFVAESLPQFGPILSLIGGSTTTLLAYILPPMFYLKMCRMEGGWDMVYVSHLHYKYINCTYTYAI